MNKKIIVFILCITFVFSISAIAIVACTCKTGLIYKNIGDTEVHIPYCEDHDHYFAPASHTFEWGSTHIIHWQVCEDCGYSSNITEPHNFIWRTTSTTHRRICSECGYLTGEIPHTLDNWGRCTQCGEDVSEGLMSITPVAQ